MHDLTGEIVQGRYRVLKCIGDGAMGSVYLAERKGEPGSRYALKALKLHLTHDPSFAERFALEGVSLQRLVHPNIVQAHDHFSEGSRYFIVLSYVDGISLADLLDRQGRLPPAQALAIIKPILSALDYAHQHGLIHRDVKPSNILLDASGRPLLCDFGIARDIGRRGLTKTGVTLGTPEYMSPEQVLGLRTLNHRSDVYSVGVVLFEMLTGRVPFDRRGEDSDFGVRQEHVRTEAPDPRKFEPSLSEGLSRVVLKALRKDPARRYSGCADMRRALENCEREGSAQGPAQQASRPADSGRSGSRSYRVYVHPSLAPTAVKYGFSWPALFGHVFWMFAKGLHRHALTWLAAWFGLILLTGLIAGAAGSTVAGLLFVGGSLVLVVTPGLRGNEWQAVELARSGYTLQRTVRAPTAEAAVLNVHGFG